MSCAQPDNDLELHDEQITCWCGARGTYAELFDDSGLEQTCGGTGTLHCDCGGDFCVCHHHGEVECDGCIDCVDDPDDLLDDDWDEFVAEMGGDDDDDEDFTPEGWQ